MPYMKNGKRDYKTEYNKYHSRKKQRVNRSLRNQARASYEARNGDLPASVDVDHRKPLSKGGSNSGRNLRVLSRSANRSFKRTRSGAIA
jgi:5-methylcytosine-specific restriction endonuclease McrA